jgi:hypothetical protein
VHIFAFCVSVMFFLPFLRLYEFAFFEKEARFIET